MANQAWYLPNDVQQKQQQFNQYVASNPNAGQQALNNIVPQVRTGYERGMGIIPYAGKVMSAAGEGIVNTAKSAVSPNKTYQELLYGEGQPTLAQQAGLQQQSLPQQSQNVSQQTAQFNTDTGQLPYYQGRGQTGLMGEQQFQYGTGNDIAAKQQGMDKMQGTSTDVYKTKLANGQTYYTNVPEQGLPRAGAGTVSSGNMQAMDNMIAQQNGLMQPQQMQQGYQFTPIRSNVLPDYQSNQQMQRNIRDLQSNIMNADPTVGADRYKAKLSQGLLNNLLDFDVQGNQATQIGMQKMGMDESQFGNTMRNRQNEFAQTNALEQQRQGLMDRKNMMDYQQALAGLGVQGMREQRAMEAQRQKASGNSAGQKPDIRLLSENSDTGEKGYGLLTDRGIQRIPVVDSPDVERKKFVDDFARVQQAYANNQNDPRAKALYQQMKQNYQTVMGG